MPTLAYAILAAGWIFWLVPFIVARRSRQPVKQVDRTARWGILLQVLAYTILWQSRFWKRSPTGWQMALAVAFFAVAGLLAWKSTRALGRQWRIEAGLSADHELIMSGPYRWVRHPIYTSMLCMLLATGLMTVPWPLHLLTITIMLAGIQIRVRAEDALLASRFGEQFQEYRRAVPGYIPFLR